MINNSKRQKKLGTTPRYNILSPINQHIHPNFLLAQSIIRQDIINMCPKLIDILIERSHLLNAGGGWYSLSPIDQRIQLNFLLVHPTGDEVQKLAVLANDLFISMLQSSYTVCAMVSEENKNIIQVCYVYNWGKNSKWFWGRDGGEIGRCPIPDSRKMFLE